MNKKEIAEIKKLFTKERSCIDRICGCYVDAEKNKVLQFEEPFLSVPEGEMYKYFDIFRKNLSGTLGKNMLNMEFPLEQELGEGTQKSLLALRDTGLKEPALVDAFYDRIIESYYHPENYLILLIYGIYDIPMKTSDGLEMEDASDYMYPFLMCSLCPVTLSKAGLCYNAEMHSITDRIRDWIIGLPEQGFLFPAFNDRNTDVHSLLYYTKKPEEVSAELTEQVLGCVQPVTAGAQKASFAAIVEETLGEDCSYGIVRNLHDTLDELVEEAKESPDPVELDKLELKNILRRSGAPEEKLPVFEEKFDQQLGEQQRVMAKNIADTRKFEVKTADVVVKVNPKRSDLVETRMIDGRRCLVIALEEGVEVNGIHVSAEGDSGAAYEPAENAEWKDTDAGSQGYIRPGDALNE